MNHILVALTLALGLIVGVPQARALDADPPRLSPDKLRQDLSYIREVLAKTHPDLNFSANPAQLDLAFQAIERALDRPMTKDEAWRQFSTLNPMFGDAHVTVVNPDSRTQTLNLIQSGQGLFPFEVTVNAAGLVHVLSELGGTPSVHTGSRIVRINSEPIESVSRALLARTNGDTPGFRAANLSTRWWWFYWKTFGAPQAFEIELMRPSGMTLVQIPATQQLPLWIKDNDPANFDGAFRFWSLNEKIAVLTVNTFETNEKERFTPSRNPSSRNSRAQKRRLW